MCYAAGEDHVAALKCAVDFGKQCLEQSPQVCVCTCASGCEVFSMKGGGVGSYS